MADYGTQKRNTLDNITDAANRVTRAVIRDDLRRRSNDILFQLNSGKKYLEDDSVRNLADPMDNIFERHEFVSVRTGISDGMQEVTPENELGLWKLLPNNHDPIQTLTQLKPQLGKKRDDLTTQFIKKNKKNRAFTLKALRTLFLGDYLRILRRGYQDLAKDWIAGEGTIDDVQAMLSITFGATSVESKRIFRTETTNNFNDARADYFINETSMDYMQIFAITDGRISNICEDRHLWVFPISEANQKSKKPAFHPNCRTIQRPLTSRLASHRKMIDKGLAMDERRFTPLPKGWA